MPILASFSSSSRTAGFFKRPASTSVTGRLYMWGVNYYGTGNGSGNYSYAGSTLGTFGAEVTWTSITVGGNNNYGTEDYSLFTKNNGTMWAVGYNGSRVFGDGTTNTKTSPGQIGSSTDWAKVSTGLYHSMAIKTNGTLWATGNNSLGQLGLGDASTRSSWTQVGSSTWVDVACSFYTTLAIKSDGTLWGWGYSAYGQVGDGTTSNRSSPVQVGSRTDWVKIAAGYYGSIGITADGKLWAWGYWVNLPSGGASNYSPIQVGSDTNWAEVSLGLYHGIAVKTTGTMWGWGYSNSYGQLGTGNYNASYTPVQIGSSTNWSKISTGYLSSFAINTSGSLYGWGLNNNESHYQGQLQYGLDCFSVDYNKSLGFANNYQYTYTETGYQWACPYSYICDYDGNGYPICFDYDYYSCSACYQCGVYGPQLQPYEYSINCYDGKHPSPVLLASGTGNTFLALAKGCSGFHHAAIRTS